ncbi:TPA: glycosyltransferase [Vibrio vulnificus]
MIGKIKSIVKSNKKLIKIYEIFFQRDIVNLFNQSHSKRVLFSYSTYHFSKANYTRHSNYNESKVIAELFDSLGFQVDVVNNNRNTNLELSKYDVIFGEGIPIYQAIESNVKAKKIYYGTGSHPFHCSSKSIARLIDFYREKTFLAAGSLRTNDSRWGIAASLADSVICIGNEVTKNTFKEQGALNVYTLDPSFHARDDALTIGRLKNFDVCRRSALWFGSYGLLHKGLDLAVEAFRENPSWTLHICGYTDAEKELLDAIHLPENVVVHGFVNVFSEDFKRLCNDCGFVLLPSCSEGIATAVITAVANGAMIPLVTDESGFDTNGNGFKIELNAESIAKVMSMINELSSDTLKQMSLDVQIKTLRRYTIENYKNNMRRYLKEILSHE